MEHPRKIEMTSAQVIPFTITNPEVIIEIVKLGIFNSYQLMRTTLRC